MAGQIIVRFSTTWMNYKSYVRWAASKEMKMNVILSFEVLMTFVLTKVKSVVDKDTTIKICDNRLVKVS